MCAWTPSGVQFVMTFGDQMRYVLRADNLDFKYQVSCTIILMGEIHKPKKVKPCPYYAGLVPLANQCLIQERGLGDETYHFYAIHIRFCIYTIL